MLKWSKLRYLWTIDNVWQKLNFKLKVETVTTFLLCKLFSIAMFYYSIVYWYFPVSKKTMYQNLIHMKFFVPKIIFSSENYLQQRIFQTFLQSISQKCFCSNLSTAQNLPYWLSNPPPPHTHIPTPLLHNSVWFRAFFPFLNHLY